MFLSLGPHSSNLMKGGWKDLNKLGFLGRKNMPGIFGVLSVFFRYFKHMCGVEVASKLNI